MSKQRLLFQPQRRPWVDQLWRRIPPKRRREIIAVLAEMARITLKHAKTSPLRREKEGDDES
jgi:hypothetical protein